MNLNEIAYWQRRQRLWNRTNGILAGTAIGCLLGGGTGVAAAATAAAAGGIALLVRRTRKVVSGPGDPVYDGLTNGVGLAIALAAASLAIAWLGEPPAGTGYATVATQLCAVGMTIRAYRREPKGDVRVQVVQARGHAARRASEAGIGSRTAESGGTSG